jgi:hypothetical protein
MAATVARTQIIEGRKTLVMETKPPLQPKLDRLLGAMTLVVDYGMKPPAGTASSCEMRQHRFLNFRDGRHVGLDGIVRDLRLQMCADCGAVCVRDRSFDRLDGLTPGRSGPARRDHVLGWYSGARRNRREYR